jgi:hypothetical protein
MKRAFHASMVALSIGMSGAWPTGIAATSATPDLVDGATPNHQPVPSAAA